MSRRGSYGGYGRSMSPGRGYARPATPVRSLPVARPVSPVRGPGWRGPVGRPVSPVRGPVRGPGWRGPGWRGPNVLPIYPGWRPGFGGRWWGSGLFFPTYLAFQSALLANAAFAPYWQQYPTLYQYVQTQPAIPTFEQFCAANATLGPACAEIYQSIYGVPLV